MPCHWLEFLSDYVLLGLSDTDNDLEKEVGGYEHVVVLRNVKVVDGDAVDILHNLPRGTHNGDCIQYQFFEELFARLVFSYFMDHLLSYSYAHW